MTALATWLYGLAFASSTIPQEQLVTRIGDKDVFAPAFRGTWSKSVATCRQEDSLETFVISETRLEGYEWDSVLLRTTPMIVENAPGEDQWANTVLVLTADRAETEVSFGKRRLSLLGDKLYMSNPEAVKEDDHLEERYANVRCR